MAEKRRLSLAFSMAQQNQREAWEHVSSIPPGHRMDAICKMINGYMTQQELLKAIRQILREELSSISINQKYDTKQEQAGDMDADVLGFLLSLQEGDETT